MEERAGLLVFKAQGKNVKNIFSNESGGHRWQRVPPTEKRGRVHTSTITVAVFSDDDVNIEVNPDDISWYATKGSGPGGQHKNKTESMIVATHKPTGITSCSDGRSQHQNRELAIESLIVKVKQHLQREYNKSKELDRKNQVGSGQRGDKIRTIRVQDDIVTNNVNGRKMSYSKYVRGILEELVI